MLICAGLLMNSSVSGAGVFQTSPSFEKRPWCFHKSSWCFYHNLPRKGKPTRHPAHTPYIEMLWKLLSTFQPSYNQYIWLNSAACSILSTISYPRFSPQAFPSHCWQVVRYAPSCDKQVSTVKNERNADWNLERSSVSTKHIVYQLITLIWKDDSSHRNTPWQRTVSPFKNLFPQKKRSFHSLFKYIFYFCSLLVYSKLLKESQSLHFNANKQQTLKPWTTFS